jgi:hypothetical protein
MASCQVKIGPSFFKKAKNDYSDWKFGWVREILQNSIDAPHARRIIIEVERDGSETTITVSNDGAPMGEYELTEKLLALGESGKDFQGTVGGFGLAKQLLYFCHLRYTITTGDLQVIGSGGDYELTTNPDSLDGTVSKVWMAGNEVEDFLSRFRQFIYMTQWHGTFVVNGTEMQGVFRKGSRRREFDWATIYTNKSLVNQLVVRIHGIPMFTRHVDADGRCVVVELNRGDAEVLQSNRDALKWSYQRQLDSFVDQLTVDKSSAFRDTAPRYLHFSGEKLRMKAMQAANQAMHDLIAEAYATIPAAAPVDLDEVAVAVPDGVDVVDHQPMIAAKQTAAVHEEATKQQMVATRRTSKISHEFVIKNTTGMEVPTHYQPFAFSSYSTKLASCWAKCLLALHELFGEKSGFSIGFIFDDSREAEREEGDYGTVYYINPISIVTQSNSKSRSMSKRWKLTPAGKYAILADAVHEFCHCKIGYHDENFASELTTKMGIVLNNLRKFYPCFR